MLANLVLWVGCMFIRPGLAAIGSTKQATSRPQARIHVSREAMLSLDDARAQHALPNASRLTRAANDC